MDGDVLTTMEDCSESDEEDSCHVGSDMPPEFNNYWKAAIEKPHNFSAWTKLVSYAESEKHLAACMKAYDKFLERFPLCHIYWKKYADLVQHLGNKEETEKIFARAVKCNPLNVIMWINYIQYLKKSMNMSLTKSVDTLRGAFKEAVQAAGKEFHSDELWRIYIEFETQQNNLKGVTALFDQVLTIPTQQYETQYGRFKVFVFSHSPVEILNPEERRRIRLRIQLENDDYRVAAEDVDDSVEPITESDIPKFREYIIKVREQLYLLNEEEVQKRWTFEEGIKRLYFYATPINVKQLNNWRKYLQFEVSQGQHERIVILYERCLMTCALYEEFWLSYAQYIEGHSVEAARSVFERACRIHLPVKYSLHLQWAAFEEKHGCLDSAHAILCHLENTIPGLAIVRMRRVGLEKRNGNLQEAERLLKEAIQMSAGTKLAGFYAVKLSRLILKLQRDPHKAKAVLKEALKKDPDNAMLHVNLLEVEMFTEDAKDAPLVCVEQALKCKLSDDSKRILSEKRLDYLEEYGSLASWMDAYSEHQTYLKRKTDNGKNEDKEKDKKVKTNSKKNKNKNAKSTSSSEDCDPPGVTSYIPNKNEFVSANSVSTTNVSAAENHTPAAESSSTKASDQTTTVLSQAYLEPYPSRHYYNPRPFIPPARPYFNPPRTYIPPQNIPMQPFFRNQFVPPQENMFLDFHHSMVPSPPFSGPPGPPFMDNPGMHFRMPHMFGYGPSYQNFGGHPWNRFFPPQ
ncbi:pre-mRNA-processing factor 39-like [Pyxicephalus adspersus]